MEFYGGLYDIKRASEEVKSKIMNQLDKIGLTTLELNDKDGPLAKLGIPELYH
jgi:hypothetical protein